MREVIEGVTVTGLARNGSVWRVETSDGPIEAPKVVNAAGAWADRIAAQLGEPVPLEVIAPMLMVSSRVPPFIDPVVILRGRKLSFKQLANGTVVIGGGHLAVPYRDENRTVIDWTKLATSARTVWELFPAMREAHHRARLGRHRGAHAGRNSGRRAEPHRRRACSTSSASPPTASSSGRRPAR